VIAAGDFNTRPREPLYGELTALWSDLTRELRDSCNCGTTIQPQHPSEWIDYVLARQTPAWSARCERAVRIENAAKDDPYSDHHGLDLTLRLEPAVSLRDLGSAAALAAIHGPSTRRHWLAAWTALALQRVLR
jgi:endonuclease/exonuclease/phosphatase family metal-dependent hydrolase